MELDMKAHLAYLSYVLRHRLFVFVEACRFGIPLLGLLHDWHKFLPDEWFPYVHYFYNADGTRKIVRKDDCYVECEAFQSAWFLHQKRSWHHWQSWCYPDVNGNLRAMPIPDRHLKEMLADWYGSAQAKGKTQDSVREWFWTNCGKMLLHEDTADWLVKRLQQEAHHG